MAANIIQFGQNAHESLRSGINELADIVKTTLGPRGKNVIIDRPEANPLITQNGREIAEMLELPDPSWNLGVKVLRDIAIQTGDVTGKGTSTAIVIAQAMIESGFASIDAGASSTDLRDGLQQALKVVVSELKSQSNTINSREEIRQIVELAVNGDSELADLMVSAFEKVGKEGIVLAANGRRRESELQVKTAMHFDTRLLTETSGSLIIDDAYVLLTDEKIAENNQILHILEMINRARRDLVIVTVEITDEMLDMIHNFNRRHSHKVTVVEAPDFGHVQKAILQDLAIFSGANVITREVGLNLEHATLDDLGMSKKLFVDQNSVDFVDGAGYQRDIYSRITQIRRQIEEAESDEDRQVLQDRLQNLSGGSALISVGGISKENVNQRRVMARHALIAVKASFSEGVVPGGGVAYIRAQQALNQLRSQRPALAPAIDIVSKAMEAPLRAIAANADEDPDTVVKKVQGGSGSFGYNAKTRSYEDLAAAGINDPVKVLRTAFENALHFSGLVLTTDTCITNQQ